MNDKALVEIMVPATAREYDVFIPLASKMSDVTRMVAMAISDLSEGKYKATEQSVLCNADTGIIYNINVEVAELGIKTGSRLMLI